MLKKFLSYFFATISLCTLNNIGYTQTREITITIDDLPFVGTTHNKPGNLRRERERFTRIMDALIKHKVPATGFVVAGTIEKDQWQLLEKFRENGFVIANHTYSHANLNRSSAKKYMNDIKKADQMLSPLMTKIKYFRYPYLAEGRGKTKQEVQEYLSSLNYTITPVTIDSKDFRFNEQLLSIYWRNRPKYLNSIKNRYLNYIWRQTIRAEKRAKGKPIKQILLIHANLLNSHALGEVIQMYKNKGYRFITLDEAMANQQSTVPTI